MGISTEKKHIEDMHQARGGGGGGGGGGEWKREEKRTNGARGGYTLREST